MAINWINLHYMIKVVVGIGVLGILAILFLVIVISALFSKK